MKWMQFFTPVSSINWEEAHRLVSANPKGDVVFLDVRQPKEYNAGHLPGARLVPVGELDNDWMKFQKTNILSFTEPAAGAAVVLCNCCQEEV